MNIIRVLKAPNITLALTEKLRETTKNEEYILVFQLKYRDNHTIYHLNNVECIIFHEEYMEIRLKTQNTTYYDYNQILEYNIIKSEDIDELWRLEI